MRNSWNWELIIFQPHLQFSFYHTNWKCLSLYLAIKTMYSHRSDNEILCNAVLLGIKIRDPYSISDTNHRQKWSWKFALAETSSRVFRLNRDVKKKTISKKFTISAAEIIPPLLYDCWGNVSRNSIAFTWQKK